MPMAESPHKVEVEAPVPAFSFKKRASRLRENVRKRPASPEPASASDKETSGYSSSEEVSRQGHRTKRRQRRGGVAAAASTNNGSIEKEEPHNTSTTKQKLPLVTNDATKATNWYDEDIKTKIGPTRVAATNVRMTTFTDFAPDVCKDYKKTGFCGFGQNCVFLHDRSDYKQGWELDREWENVTKGSKNLAGTVVASANRSNNTEGRDDDEGEEEAMLKDIPFACIICQQAYKTPIITKCGHYFCESCALKRYRKDPKCAACGTGTNGVFNTASRLKKLLDRKRERLAKKREAAIEAGEEISDEDE
ncbi:RNA-splicing factor [Ophidiomyces ophidiicola]|nr:RNA-splicing factor [Ophidiomyces ophidiicola]KAI2010450.1 RNA-splicing factor [Ophidiomyces ophidiicola]KAI2025769.1 RNA-splicing factor [Ophidiomyces ophidiicola]KAI2142426.1 RNA-splicing factor [Ophidiomyces ophidiicola]KAI2145485.1 RNA-splicing factor [Ophidiomyces ophidiicola]